MVRAFPVTEARRAVTLIADELTMERFKGLFIIMMLVAFVGEWPGRWRCLAFRRIFAGIKTARPCFLSRFQTHAFTNYASSFL